MLISYLKDLVIHIKGLFIYKLLIRVWRDFSRKFLVPFVASNYKAKSYQTS